MQIEILTIGKPDKGNVKITAIILTPLRVAQVSTYLSPNDTNEERDWKNAAHAADIAKRDNKLEAITRLHLGNAELIQEVSE